MSSLVTVLQYEAFTGVDVPTIDEPRYLNMLNVASELVREACGWHIAPVRTEDVTVNGRGGQMYWVPTKRLTDVHVVTFWPGRTSPYGDWEEVWDEDDVELSDTFAWSEEGLIERWWYGTVPVGVASIKTNITHGYAATPDTVIAVICMMVERAVAVSVPGAKRVKMQTGLVLTDVEYGDAVGSVALGGSETVILRNYVLENPP